ncbi:hypothetical protein EC957_005681 [Mortierella hygrophila]|uniref:BZIP domain-containing protein n=1 Tax=Mortierella hygrophila TaxID=979708 RepID=A0A9P6FDE3_9FUNG|nr:hypothetical protein EC957_005681 [Mortierella hygrophila]
MNFGNPDANVEDMSNSELFQYLFKAELDSDPQQQQEEQLAQVQLFQQQPTLLPSTSFSYRQISPNMPPSMPNQMTVDNNDNYMNLPQTSSAIDAITASSTSTDQMSYWMQRFQQLQQLQQVHHHQQQQLLSSTLFPSQAAAVLNLNTVSTIAGSSGQEDNHSTAASPSSPASSASSSSPTIKAEHYPSPPMKDDMAMDSDSDDGESPSQDAGGSDPLKPSPSELKKMTSKERRQLRNKLSARNFRVRRKEYIGTLETQVKEARREAAELQKKLAQSELNCQFLRQELETSRLSQTLFNDGRMSREHANLLASLLNPNTESFPTSSPPNTLATSSLTSSIVSAQELQQKELMNSIDNNNMTILNNALTANQQQQQLQQQSTIMSLPQGSMQPFVPFDINWDPNLSVNRAELIVNPDLDPKEAEAKSTVHALLARYEAAKHEAEVDEQMRTELKAYHEQKLAQTYIVMPKEDTLSTTWTQANRDSMFLQTMVYMMMLHLTRSLFEAATLSKTQIVNVYQSMDGNLRSQMGQVQEEQEKRVTPCKFAEWREAWIRKCWPSFYNNRQRVCELLKNNICPIAAYSTSADVDETVRKMEEGVKGKVVETVHPLCLWIRSHIPNWLRCPDSVAQEKREQEEREALLNKANQPIEVTV